MAVARHHDVEQEALVAFDALGTVDAAAAVCRWSCDLSGIKF